MKSATTMLVVLRATCIAVMGAAALAAPTGGGVSSTTLVDEVDSYEGTYFRDVGEEGMGSRADGLKVLYRGERIVADDGCTPVALIDKVKQSASVPGERVELEDAEEKIVPEHLGVGPYAIECEGGRIYQDVFIAFDSSDPKEGVYLDPKSKAAERKTYLTSEEGIIWQGGHEKAWAYDQNSQSVYEALELLFIRVPYTEDFEAIRTDPARIARYLSGVINHAGDKKAEQKGILVGKWSGEYADGVAPQTWRGSGAILKQFVKTNGEPVKYGQCWVYAGLLTTLLRALGIPSRPVTAFNSGHDTGNAAFSHKFDHTIDKFWSDDGLTGDSVWNFHVWTEAWIARKDVSEDAGHDKPRPESWQVLDGTPQELSLNSEKYECGPAAVNDVRKSAANGERSLDYDTDFVVGEVAAEVHTWQPLWKTNGKCKKKHPDPSREYCLYERKCGEVGTRIATMGLDGKEESRLDAYKPRGSSSSGRYGCAVASVNLTNAANVALATVRMRRGLEEDDDLGDSNDEGDNNIIDSEQDMVSFKMRKLSKNKHEASNTMSIHVGEPIKANFFMSMNKGFTDRQLDVHILVNLKAETYANTYQWLVKRASFKIRLHPERHSHARTLVFEPNHYGPFLKHGTFFRIEVVAHVVDRVNEVFEAVTNDEESDSSAEAARTEGQAKKKKNAEDEDGDGAVADQDVDDAGTPISALQLSDEDKEMDQTDLTAALVTTAFGGIVGAVAGFYNRWDGVSDKTVPSSDFFAQGGVVPDQTFMHDIHVNVNLPKVKMSLLKTFDVQGGREVHEVAISFKNPLFSPLDRPQFVVGGEGLQVCTSYSECGGADDDKLLVWPRALKQGETLEFHIQVIKNDASRTLLQTRMISSELIGVDGHIFLD